MFAEFKNPFCPVTLMNIMKFFRFASLLCLLLFVAGCSKGYYVQQQQPYSYAPPPSSYIVPVQPNVSYGPYTQPFQPSKTIILDAGHGGKDRGCEHCPEDCHEKGLNLQTTYMVKDHLEKLGYRVFMTRTQDVFVSLDDRASMANEQNASLFVSVHFNAAANPKAKGIEVYYCDLSSNPIRTQNSKRLAKCILDATILSTEAASRGVKTANFRVIKKTVMPAALIECGFLTHPEERTRCKDPNYMNALARGIAKGVDNYLKEEIAKKQ